MYIPSLHCDAVLMQLSACHGLIGSVDCLLQEWVCK